MPGELVLNPSLICQSKRAIVLPMASQQETVGEFSYGMDIRRQERLIIHHCDVTWLHLVSAGIRTTVLPERSDTLTFLTISSYDFVVQLS